MLRQRAAQQPTRAVCLRLSVPLSGSPGVHALNGALAATAAHQLALIFIVSQAEPAQQILLLFLLLLVRSVVGCGAVVAVLLPCWFNAGADAFHGVARLALKARLA